MKKPPSEDEIKFVFQDVGIEVLDEILAGKSKYAGFANQIVAKVRSMQDGRTFLFAPVKDAAGKIKIESFRGFLNKALVREGLPWRILFSEKEKKFAAAPIKRQAKKQVRGPYKKSSDPAVPLTQALVGATIRTLGVRSEELRTSQRNNHTEGRDKIVSAKLAMMVAGRTLGLTGTQLFPLIGAAGSSTVFTSLTYAETRKDIQDKAALILKALQNGGSSK